MIKALKELYKRVWDLLDDKCKEAIDMLAVVQHDLNAFHDKRDMRETIGMARREMTRLEKESKKGKQNE